MERALVLNAAMSWGAYQVGALRWLLAERGQHFDLYAGTGMGAINAALAACAGYGALDAFWTGLNWRRLIGPNWRTPRREGPATLAPLRRFLAPRLSETRLAARGARLMVSALDLQSGAERVWTYPGGDLPVLDAVCAAAALPGLVPPVILGGHQLVSASLANNWLLPKLLDLPLREIVAVAAAIPERSPVRPWYTTMLPALERDLAMNQANDVRLGLATATAQAQTAAAFRQVHATVPDRVAGRIADPDLRERVRARLAAVYADAAEPLPPGGGPVVRTVAPSADLPYPLWRFPRAGLAAARVLGYRDAQAAFPAADAGLVPQAAP